MDFNEYQRAAEVTDQSNGNTDHEKLMYYALGIAGESGELVDKIKKGIRNGWTIDRIRDEVVKEGGDVLWYLAGICRFLGIEFGYLPEGNLDKILDRQKRGVLLSEGDDR